MFYVPFVAANFFAVLHAHGFSASYCGGQRARPTFTSRANPPHPPLCRRLPSSAHENHDAAGNEQSARLPAADASVARHCFTTLLIRVLVPNVFAAITQRYLDTHKLGLGFELATFRCRRPLAVRRCTTDSRVTKRQHCASHSVLHFVSFLFIPAGTTTTLSHTNKVAPVPRWHGHEADMRIPSVTSLPAAPETPRR
jgi:hypothetical protein